MGEGIEVTLFRVLNGWRERVGTAEVKGEHLPSVVIWGARAFIRTTGTEYEEEPAERVNQVVPDPRRWNPQAAR